MNDPLCVSSTTISTLMAKSKQDLSNSECRMCKIWQWYTVSYNTHIFVKKLKNFKFLFQFSVIEVVLYSPIRCLITKNLTFCINLLSQMTNNRQFMPKI